MTQIRPDWSSKGHRKRKHRPKNCISHFCLQIWVASCSCRTLIESGIVLVQSRSGSLMPVQSLPSCDSVFSSNNLLKSVHLCCSCSTFHLTFFDAGKHIRGLRCKVQVIHACPLPCSSEPALVVSYRSCGAIPAEKQSALLVPAAALEPESHYG